MREPSRRRSPRRWPWRSSRAGRRRWARCATATAPSPTWRIFGVTAPYQVVQDYSYLAGSPLTDQDVSEPAARRRAWATRSPTSCSTTRTAAVGKRVRLDGREVTVKGVIAPKGRLLGQSFDAFVLLPFSTFEAAYGRRKTTVVSVKMPTAEAIESGDGRGRKRRCASPTGSGPARTTTSRWTRPTPWSPSGSSSPASSSPPSPPWWRSVSWSAGSSS